MVHFLFLIALSILIQALRGEVSSVPHHHIFSSMVQSNQKTQEKPICRAYVDSKRSYCERHNYTFKYYEDVNYEPNTHPQEPLSLRLHLARAYLFSRTVKQLTYLDFDTVIIQPEKTLESIFAAEQAKCSAVSPPSHRSFIVVTTSPLASVSTSLL